MHVRRKKWQHGKPYGVVIISNDAGKKWIIYIELKQGKNGARIQIIKQLEGAMCFIEYCQLIGQTFFGKFDFLNTKEYQQRYVSVKNIGMNKNFHEPT